MALLPSMQACSLHGGSHPKELYLSEIGPIIGAHTGPNMMAVVFIGTHKTPQK